MNDVAMPMGGRYASTLAITEETGWTLDQQEASPPDLLEEILVRRAARSYWTNQRRKLDANG